MGYDVHAILGYFVVLCVFLHLRIFDDHKDYQSDCRYFPDRVLQRGVVTLYELKWIAALAISVELTASAVAGRAAFISVVITLCFTLLMLKEFFVHDWLQRHFLIYVFTHMLIMPLLAMVVFSFATGRYLWQAPGWYWMYAAVGFFVALSWEVSRKIRAPDDEIDGVDSYTKLFGTYGAAYLVLAIRVVDTGLVTLVAHHLGLSVWFYGWLLLMFLICLVGFFHYRFRTTTATARQLATYAGFYIVAFDLALTVELICTYGVAWGETK